MVTSGVELNTAIRVQAKEAGEVLTNTQVVERARNMRTQSHYREVINEKKEEMELRIIGILDSLDKDVIEQMSKFNMGEKLEIIKIFQSRLGIMNREGGITLNVAVLGDDSGSRRKMNINPTPNDWAWDNDMGIYVHLPTMTAMRQKIETSFKKHPSCSDSCQRIKEEQEVFGEG